jgi:hypothetical protein
MNSEYEYTGKSLPQTLEKCISFVIETLRKYDENINNNIHVDKSPYNSKIIMETKEGKYIEIPMEVQNEAIQKWLYEKENPKNIANQPKLSIKQKKQQESSYDILLIILVILMLIFCIYYLSTTYCKN